MIKWFGQSNFTKPWPKNLTSWLDKQCSWFMAPTIAENTKGGSITVPLTSCLTALESVV
jgi:hypothetical protein